MSRIASDNINLVKIGNSLYKLLEDELIVLDGDETIKLTDKGLNVANIVWEEFI